MQKESSVRIRNLLVFFIGHNSIKFIYVYCTSFSIAVRIANITFFFVNLSDFCIMPLFRCVFIGENYLSSNPIRHTDVSFHHSLPSSYYIYPARGRSLYLTSLQVIGRTFCILGCTGA